MPIPDWDNLPTVTRGVIQLMPRQRLQMLIAGLDLRDLLYEIETGNLVAQSRGA